MSDRSIALSAKKPFEFSKAEVRADSSWFGDDPSESVGGEWLAGSHPPSLWGMLGPIDIHLPLKEYRSWLDFMKTIYARKEEKKVKDYVGSIFPGLIKGFTLYGESIIQSGQLIDLWTRAIVRITVQTCGRISGLTYSDRFAELFTITGTLEDQVRCLTALDELYRGPAQEAAAGPAAFFWLAQGLSLTLGELNFDLSSPRTLLFYFETLRILMSEGARPEFNRFVEIDLGKRDRCFEFLLQQLQDRPSGQIKEGGHLPERSRWKGIIESFFDRKKKSKVTKICLIGPQESGKTSIVRSLYEGVSSDVYYPGRKLALHPSETQMKQALRVGDGYPSHESETATYCGTVQVGSEDSPRFEIADTVGKELSITPPNHQSEKSSWPKITRLVRDADLLVLVIPPSYFIAPPTEALVTRRMIEDQIRFLDLSEPRPMVSIAYSKCDEYGVAPDIDLRVIETEEDRRLFDHFCHSEVEGRESAWNAFVNAVTGRGASPYKSLLRKSLLDKTRWLWELIGHKQDGKGNAFVNGYFVTAIPMGAEFTVSECSKTSGVLHLFSDFFAR
jgi:hypothetical protein